MHSQADSTLQELTLEWNQDQLAIRETVPWVEIAGYHGDEE